MKSPSVKGASIGIARFRHTQGILHRMIEVKSDENVNSLLNSVIYPEDIDEPGPDSMGQGLLTALKVRFLEL